MGSVSENVISLWRRRATAIRSGDGCENLSEIIFDASGVTGANSGNGLSGTGSILENSPDGLHFSAKFHICFSAPEVPATMPIQYLIGDATQPTGDGNKIIAHVCNDVGAWGNGFVLAVSKRWIRPRTEYLHCGYKHLLKLGMVQLVKVEKTIWVVNMIAQRDTVPLEGLPPIRYEALAECLKQLSFHALQLRATIHMPRIGCGLAGGRWEEVEPLIVYTLPETGVFVYDLPGAP
jgi:O-acetyl-ADP-ribose deacetylase (regulator of RNase III)